jgi:hypothetical protein
MRPFKQLAHLASATVLLAASCADAVAAETIVFMRHGEKPDGGLGQLSCQGLQRSLALPVVLSKKFDRPMAIFAPNPGQLKHDGGKPYNYVRPLATIEPTAIALGMPVDTRFGFRDTTRLEAALVAPALRNATVFVAWEHAVAEQVAKDLLRAKGADSSVVPHWDGGDFDSLYIVTIADDGAVRFDLDRQGITPSERCPLP